MIFGEKVKGLSSSLLLITILLVSSCKQDMAKVVNAVTGGILEPVSMTVTPGTELGEVVVGEEPIEMKISVRNNSSDRIRKVSLEVDKSQNLLKFKENSAGEAVTPGQGGTCNDTLASGGSCYFVLLFNPRKSGVFSISVKLKYENLIEPQEKEVVINALTGEPASLVFTNDITNYDLGVIEQTEKVKRFLDLEIANKGGLSAKEIATSLINSTSDQAFKIEKNDCPKNLEPGKVCKIQLSYEPFNNSYTDAAIDYKSQLTLIYQRDSKGTMSNLNNYAAVKSATIEANFKENFKTVDFGVVTTGNKVNKSVRITNIGYRAGIIKEMIISDYTGNPLATCKKGTGLLLDCQKDLKDFPFVIEDTNSCFDNQTEGVIGKTPGHNCFFTITYWPSLTWESASQSTHYFNEAKITLVYDSQWKGAENIVTKSEMFEMYADFLSVAKLALQDVIVNTTALDLSKIDFTSQASAGIDLGRLALVSSSAYSTYIKITWKNIGENVAILDSIYDRHSPLANQISELGYDLNAFYRQIKASAGCGFVSPGATCNISFNLTPVVQTDSSIEDQYMFDNITDPLKKIKSFIVRYEDGSKFEDDGSSSGKRTFENNITAKLIKKGSLAFTSPASISTKIVHGQTGLQTLCLTNVGTGDIYAIMDHPSENYNPASQNWPYRVQDLNTIPSSCTKPATKDCYDIIYPATATLPMVPNSAKFLGAGETCVLSVEVKIPETYRKQGYASTDNYKRPYGPNRSGTERAWERHYYAQDPTLISYYYYDGDYISSDSASYLNYGYKRSTIQKTTVSATFYGTANIIIENPTPITSALLHRPAISYPTLTSTYPSNYTLASQTVAEAYFTNSYFTSGLVHGFTKSDDAITHFKTLNLTGSPYNTQYKIHLGTFPVGETVYGAFDFTNKSGGANPSAATNAVLTETNDPTNPISIESYFNLTTRPFPSMTIVSGQLINTKLKFAPTAPGLYSRCYTMDYYDGLQDQQQYICVYAEAVANSPKMKIEYKDVEVAMPGPTESTAGASFVTLTAPINRADGTSTTFTGIKGSAVYAKKIFRVTNTGNVTAKRFNYYYMDSESNAKTTVPPDTTLEAASTKGCSLSITLAPGDYCDFIIKYQPTKSSSANLSRYLGIIYEIAPDSNQYVSQVAGITFNSQDPAKLAMADVTAESITDWSVPTAPIPVDESWPFDLKSYNRSTNPHFILSNLPETRTFSVVTIKNLSTLKASFLFMNATPSSGTWNDIYSNTFINVKANRACFYGDDELNAAIPSSQKGFNSATVAPCQLLVQFSGHQTYTLCSAWNATTKTKTTRIGDAIESTCNPYSFKLQYYNNNRASYESMNFHVKGYIEPNRSTTAPAAAVFSNVSANFVSGSVGRVAFSWPALSANNSAWGGITKYRVYYDTTPSNLNGTNIFKLSGGPSFVETANAATNSVTINNLTVGRYYYFRVVAMRSYTGINYVSDSNLPILTLPIPASDHVYHHATRTLIDKTYITGTGTRPNGITACAAKTYNLVINGTTVKPTKSLITTPTWNYLITDPTLSTGYPADGIGSLPHWLGDAAYDMKTSISLYNGAVLPGFPGYLSSSMSGNNADYLAIYQKTCNNNATCDQLFKIVGGDDVDLYYQGVFFAKDTAVQAFFRCQAVIRCPTNTAKLITDGSCVAP